MATQTIIKTAQSIAKTAGYYIREGAYRGTTDDRLGRWYVGHEDHAYAPHGAGHATRKAAWEAAAEAAREAAAQ